MPDSPALTVDAAHTILKQFDCLKQLPASGNFDKGALQQALLVVAQHSDYQMLGICAEAIAQGQQALASYAQALGYRIQPQFDPVEGPVYIKFNPKTGLCYAAPYTGAYRGVLVSCQSADEADINEMYGHLPLDLFESDYFCSDGF